jgi:hypothetical protein
MLVDKGDTGIENQLECTNASASSAARLIAHASGMSRVKVRVWKKPRGLHTVKERSSSNMWLPNK